MLAANRVLENFASQVENIFDKKNPSSFKGCEPIFRSLIKKNFAQTCIRDALENLLEFPYYKGDWANNQLTLQRGPGYAISIVLVESSNLYIHTSPFFAMYSPLLGSPLAYDRYRLPEVYENAVFNPSLQLERIESSVVSCGDILFVDPGTDVIDFRIDTAQLILKFTSSSIHVLEWLFDRETLSVIQANDAALNTTQLRVAAYILGRLGHSSSVDPLKNLSGHDIPNLRWAAIQSLSRLDKIETVKCLENALDDPHPHIRKAAKETFSRILKNN